MVAKPIQALVFNFESLFEFGARGEMCLLSLPGKG